MLFFSFPHSAFALPAPTDTPVPTAAPATNPTVAPTAVPGASLNLATPTPPPVSGWQPDAEVTFVGKTANRSGDFLDWTLQNYNWLCVNKTSENTCNNANDPLIPFWVIIRNIVYALIALFVLGTAFILIITRGQNVTVMRFVPRFILIVLLITFSFSLVQFIYIIVDIVQGFFLQVQDPVTKISHYITTSDLLYIGFDYKSFVGLRFVDPAGTYDESAFITLLLVRLTAITYYVMTGLLLVRKIILWFFIIISPIFPLLLFYRPIRNTAKIWIGEFFRWLLYAPLFVIFLHGLVVVWQSGLKLLPFDTSAAGDASKIIYPTAVNILIGGPGQAIGINNSVNYRDTFALYVVALLMLWVVILLPFLLLKIFLDYLSTLSFDNNLWLKTLANRGVPFLAGPKGGPAAPPPPPSQYQPAGSARTLPFFAARQAATLPVQYQASVQASVHESANIMQTASLSIPRMRDIARYETSLMSRDATKREQVSAVRSSLQKIANPASVSTIQEREKFSSVRQQLLAQKQKGNPIASSVLAASQVSSVATQAQTTVENRTQQIEHMSRMLTMVSNPQAAGTPVQKEKAAKLMQDLQERKQKGDKLAASILDTKEQLSKGVTADQKEKMENTLLDQLLEAEKTGNSLAQALLPEAPLNSYAVPRENLPAVNRVQQVSLEDYEEVRKLWTENYQTIEPPKGLSGEQVDRREWIKNDIDKIDQAITLLSGVDLEKINQGMSMVSSILPFLLIGGFSKSEVVAYLKAKEQAGKQVLSEIEKKSEEEESMVGTASRKAEEPQRLRAEAAIEKPLEENPASQDSIQKPVIEVNEEKK